MLDSPGFELWKRELEDARRVYALTAITAPGHGPHGHRVPSPSQSSGAFCPIHHRCQNHQVTHSIPICRHQKAVTPAIFHNDGNRRFVKPFCPWLKHGCSHCPAADAHRQAASACPPAFPMNFHPQVPKWTDLPPALTSMVSPWLISPSKSGQDSSDNESQRGSSSYSPSSSSSSSFSSDSSNERENGLDVRNVEVQTDDVPCAASQSATTSPANAMTPNVSPVAPFVTYIPEQAFDMTHNNQSISKQKHKSLFSRLFRRKKKQDRTECVHPSADQRPTILVSDLQRLVREEVLRGLSINNHPMSASEPAAETMATTHVPDGPLTSDVRTKPSSPKASSRISTQNDERPQTSKRSPKSKTSKNINSDDSDAPTIVEDRHLDCADVTSTERREFIASLSDDEVISFLQMAFAIIETNVKKGKDAYRKALVEPVIAFDDQKKIFQKSIKRNAISSEIPLDVLASLIFLIFANFQGKGILVPSSTLNTACIQKEGAHTRAKFLKSCNDKTLIKIWELLFHHAGVCIAEGLPIDFLSNGLTHHWAKKEKAQNDLAKVGFFLNSLADKQPEATPKTSVKKMNRPTESDDDSEDEESATSKRPSIAPGLGQNALGNLRPKPKPKPKAKTRLISDGGDAGFGAGMSVRAKMAAISEFEF